MGFEIIKIKGRPKALDKDRNIELFYKKGSGGSSDWINVYELIWNGEVITFSTRPQVINNGKQGEIHHDVLYLDIPEDLKPRKDEIVGFIDEALQVFAIGGNPDKCDGVTVSFQPDLINN